MVLSEVFVVLALVLANAFFAGAEIAIVALRKGRIEELAAEGRGSARAVLALREQPERFLATVQVGITVVGATAAAFGGASLADHLAPRLARIEWLSEHAETVALGLVIAAVSYLSIVLGELVPKSLALRSAERYALLVSRPLLALAFLARPLVWMLSSSANLVLKPFGDRTTFMEGMHSVDELRQLVEEATEAGTVHPQAAEIASRALELPELRAADVMVPRSKVVAIARDTGGEELKEVLLAHAKSRMPVYDGSIDTVVGYVNVKDLLALAWQGKPIELEGVVRPPFFVPESKSAVELLHEMRARRLPFGIVIDEHGGMSGIVTLEDLVEELVGEIFSEHERDAGHSIRPDADGSLLVDAALPIRDVNRELEVDLPDDGSWSTLAGLVLAL
ncbi:MAG TPA: hemolysin family protein, partial [Polyangiaceae bacterium]|nr:hemolysin family protein [Polyangiaceae bacterium]